ncbi:YhcG family protein [Jannaschia sp. R86511]|uniref:PDDEXK nuclease domain-containing protein n=1 Tax=Jannaschia sp. R86511 TaxID=3093853 RepID=UPI0036D3E6C5
MSGRDLLPAGYGDLLEQVKAEVRTSRVRAVRAANTELVGLYWRLGRLILDRQQVDGWGSKVIERLASDLRAEFPGMRGLSRSNLFYMRSFAGAWAQEAIVQQAVGRLPWGHVTVLLDKLDDDAERDWYAAAAVEHGWSRAVLAHQIASGLQQRSGAAPSNFTGRLPAVDSDLAQQMLRDPYVFDFLDLSERVGERELEAALMDRLQAFLLELGHGFAFVGRQWHFEVDGDDFYIDLLFFNWVQSRFVVVELKTGKFAPEYAGQLGFYVAWVEDNLRRADQHAETVGILLCGDRNDRVVRYSLAGATAPMAVAGYDALPPAVRDVVPSTDELADALADAPDPASGPTARDGQLEP